MVASPLSFLLPYVLLGSPLLRIYFITRAHYTRYLVKNANVLSVVITVEVFAPVYGVSMGS